MCYWGTMANFYRTFECKIVQRLKTGHYFFTLVYPAVLLYWLSPLMAQDGPEIVSWGQALEQESAWYASTEAIRIADNILLYQHKTGGWPKNIDMARRLDKEAKTSIVQEKGQEGSELNRPTMDNGATSTQMRFLAKVYAQTGEIEYRESVISGLNYLLDAQYDNGGWPQYYPIRKGYYEQITYNDDAMVNTMYLLREIYSGTDEFASLQLDEMIKDQARQSFDKGLQCILRSQIRIAGKPTVWCAQHDKVTLAPTGARSYELPSFSGSESVGVVLLLMSIDHPDDQVITAVEGAVEWFEKSKIEGIKINKIINEDGQEDLIVVKEEGAPTLWARFYDLETGKPYFCSRDGVKKDSLAEISHERRNGYRWYVESPAKVLQKYPIWREKVLEKEFHKPRVIISTDIGGTDPDDFQSMIHYLMYADRFDTEGLISSPYGDGRAKDILDMIDLYEKDLPRLSLHGDFPDPENLRSVTKQGATDFAPPQGWSDQPTEGSEWIVQRANEGSDRPLWVLVWGGLEDLAQALHDDPGIEDKIRVYWIGGPNKKWSVHAYLYIARHFPDLFFIEANSTYRGWFIDEGFSTKLSNVGFYEHHIRGKGTMGTAFGNYYGGEIKMGDTPSMVYVLEGDPEKPDGDSWGGSFIPLRSSAYRPVYRQTTTSDTIPAYSVIEWIFAEGEKEKSGADPFVWISIDGQRIDGFYSEEEGEYRVRFVPKRSDNWTYTVHSSFTELDGNTGEFVSVNPWPGEEHPTNIPLNHWWTDRMEDNTYLGIYQGAGTVSKWREAFLADWARRLDWLKD